MNKKPMSVERLLLNEILEKVWKMGRTSNPYPYSNDLVAYKYAKSALHQLMNEVIGDSERIIENTPPSQLMKQYSEQFIVEAQARDWLRQEQRERLDKLFGGKE